MHLENAEYFAKQIKKLDEVIQQKMAPFQKGSLRIQTIPGINEVSATAILAETGVNMAQFPDEAHLCSWAGVCPSNNESAGKKRAAKREKGIPFSKGF
jgi:transposase